jgi:hypothetical protein
MDRANDMHPVADPALVRPVVEPLVDHTSSQLEQDVSNPREYPQGVQPGYQQVLTPHRLPSSVQTYTYLPLYGSDEIRLLEVSRNVEGLYSFEIVHVPLATAPPFQAVSYTWGSNTKNCALTLMHGAQIAITQTLSEAMSYLSLHCDSGFLWIDQICINQDDGTEQNHQVKIMGDIYRKSSVVLVWIEEKEDLNPMLRNLFQLADQSTSNWAMVNDILKMNIPKFKASWQRMYALLSRSWFTRAWVLQEVLLPDNADVIIGSERLPIYQTLISLSNFIEAHRVELKVADDTNMWQVRQMYGAYLGRRANTVPTPFHELLSLASYSKCSNDRDRVYAFLGLIIEPDINISPDYSATVEKVFTDATVSIIRGTCSLDIFRSLGLKTDRKRRIFPTWVPNWTRYQRSTIYSRLHLASSSNLPRACQDRPHVWKDSGNPFHLAVRGKEIDLVEFVACQPLRTKDTKWGEQKGSDVLRLEEIMETLRQCQSVPTEDSTEVRVLRTITANSGREHLLSNTLRNFPGMDLRDFDMMLEAYHIFISNDNRLPRAVSSLHEAYVSSLATLSLAAHQKTLFVTSAGRYGMASRPLKGHTICVLHGSPTPIILKPHSSGRYTVIGECYLEDTMMGEAVTWKEDEAREFILM